MNIWQQVIDHELVIAHLGIAKDDVSFEEARRAISELIQWHVDVALDPEVNGGYALVKVKHLIDDGYGMEGL